MIKTRLLKLLGKESRYVLLEIIWQWLSLMAQVIIVFSMAKIISAAYIKNVDLAYYLANFAKILIGILCRIIFDRLYTRASFAASVNVKKLMREKIYEKLLGLGSGYRQQVSSAQITQMMGEGVEQLEVYFGKYISQFIYALLAPLSLFLILLRIDLKPALILLIAVPFIPMVIMIVMKVARKLLDKYFQIYYGLGDTFLEKLNGMTTLKIYQADEKAACDMDAESEQFRKVTMKVLSMQLNSTIVMDIVAYGGAAIGMLVTIRELMLGVINFEEAIIFILLSAEFFLPMRLLGSYFHIGMNGMKAADKMFEFLDLEEADVGRLEIKDVDIKIDNMSFRYPSANDMTLSNINMDIPKASFISIVGVSGSGKSTIAKLLRKQNKGYIGSIKIGGQELKNIREDSLFNKFTSVSLESYIFKGTVRENILMANSDLEDASLIKALMQVNMWDELIKLGGLDYNLCDAGANLSGGQRQRLCLARAILKDSPIYIFDEATSNIDMESEEIIMEVIQNLKRAYNKTIILISHRLANVVASDMIYMLDKGGICEKGKHSELIEKKGKYYNLFTSQMELENYAGGLADNE